MESPRKPPLVFANRVIRMMMDHSAGEEVISLPEDYMAIRVVFRKLGGLWLSVMHGDVGHIKLIRRIIVAWGQQPHRRKDNEFTELV